MYTERSKIRGSQRGSVYFFTSNSNNNSKKTLHIKPVQLVTIVSYLYLRIYNASSTELTNQKRAQRGSSEEIGTSLNNERMRVALHLESYGG